MYSSRKSYLLIIPFIAVLLVACDSSVTSDEVKQSGNSISEVPMAVQSVTNSNTREALVEVRESTAPYNNVARATADGYNPTDHWVPKMGYHHVNPSLIDGTVNHLEPEVLVYQRNPADPDQRRLGAVEYMIPTGLASKSDLDGAFPGVDGDHWHKLTLPTGSFWTLHAWIWYPNPKGVFHGENPRVGLPTGN